MTIDPALIDSVRLDLAERFEEPTPLLLEAISLAAQLAGVLESLVQYDLDLEIAIDHRGTSDRLVRLLHRLTAEADIGDTLAERIMARHAFIADEILVEFPAALHTEGHA